MITPPTRISLGRLNTPLQLLERFDTGMDLPRIWVKRDDLTGSGLSGNKVRKLEFCIAEAIESGADTLIACGGIQSNQCRAVAIAGAELGLSVHLVLRGEENSHNTGNLLLDRICGATITYISADDYRSRIWPIMNAIADEYATRGRKAYPMGPGASNELGMWGYISACEELKRDFAEHQIDPRYVVLPTGTTGTQSGLILGSRLHKLNFNTLGIAVSGSVDSLKAKIEKDLIRWKDRFSPTTNVLGLYNEILGEYGGPGYGIAEPHIYELITRLATSTGIILDPVYTAKAFFGLLEERAKGRFSDAEDIVFIHTGGIFGLMAQSHLFSSSQIE